MRPRNSAIPTNGPAEEEETKGDFAHYPGEELDCLDSVGKW